MGELGKGGIRVVSIRDHFDSGAALSGQTVLTASVLRKLEGRLGSERLQNGLSNSREALASKNRAHGRDLTLDDVEQF